MLGRKSILIAEDNAFVALDLAQAVETLDGVVIGPVASVADALVLVDTVPMSGAIVGCQLVDRDAAPLVSALIERRVPLVVQTEAGLPPALVAAGREYPVLRKPVQPLSVLAALVVIIDAQSNVPDKK